MLSKVLFALAGFLLFLSATLSTSHAVELARVGDEVITSDEYLKDFKTVSVSEAISAKTLEGKTEFLERLIAKRLLSRYFRSQGWDTLTLWNDVIGEYEKGQYLQALYIDAIPEAADPSKVPLDKLMDRCKQFVDSLQKAYDLKLDEKAIIFISDRSAVRRIDPNDPQKKPTVAWRELFTDKEKEMPAATFLGGDVTIGEFVAAIEAMPPFIRPTGGNSDQISLTLEHTGREMIFKHEFDKRNLREGAWFRNRMASKREELIVNTMFSDMQDRCTVTEEELRDYYETHRDDFVTQTTIKLATMTFESRDVADQVAKKLAEGRDFESVAVDFSIYSSSESGFDTTDFIDRAKMTGLFDLLWEKEIGAVAGPVPDDRGRWMLGKLLGRLDPRLLGFEEAVPMIDERARLIKADQALADLIVKLRPGADVWVNTEALEALELPD